MQAQVQCPSCRTMNPTGKVFCISCGNAVMASPGSQQGVSAKALAPPPPPPYTPSPASTPQSAQPYSPPQPYPAQPTQAYPQPPPPISQAPYAPLPGYQPPPAQQPQYPQPAPYQPTAAYAAPPPSYQPSSNAGQMPMPQHDQYGMPVGSGPPPQYGQYGQYVQPNQYVNVQNVGAYPYSAYPDAQAAAPGAVRGGIAFWGLWLLATAVAWAVALPAGAALWDAVDEPILTNVLQGLLTNSSSAVMLQIVAVAPLFAVVGAVVGLISGIAQWLVLKWKGINAGSWISATVIGWILGGVSAWIVSVLLNTSGGDVLTGPSAGLLGDSSLGSGLLMAAVFGAVAGLVLGLVQFLSLQKHSKKASLWIIASPLAWIVAACLVILALSLIMQSGFGVQINPIVLQILYGAIIGTIAGATTGAAMSAVV